MHALALAAQVGPWNDATDLTNAPPASQWSARRDCSARDCSWLGALPRPIAKSAAVKPTPRPDLRILVPAAIGAICVTMRTARGQNHQGLGSQIN